MVKLGICAIIPLRAGSKRVKRKNLREFNGQPLFTRIIDTLYKVDEITSILIDTNDDEIKEIVKLKYPNIILIDRPEELSSEFESVNNIINYDLQFIQEKIILQTHATNPLVKPSTFQNAIKRLQKNLHKKDALFSVTRVFERYWDEEGNPVNHNPSKLIRTQDLPPFFVENSCIYLFSKDGFEKAGKNRLGTNRIMFEIDAEEAIDIDYPIDFKFAELIDKERKRS